MPPGSKPSGRGAPSARSASPLIVAVDDDERVLALLRAELDRIARGPVAFEAFTDGRTALERLREASAALVLLDWDMPEMSGQEVLEAIGRLHRDHAVVVMTFHSAQTHRAHCEALGAAGFVEKRRLVAELPGLLRRFRVGPSAPETPGA